jgi:hypothetical protein
VQRKRGEGKMGLWLELHLPHFTVHDAKKENRSRLVLETA